MDMIDAILNETEPSYTQSGMSDAKRNGDSFRDLSGDDADEAFLNDIAGDSEHTVMPMAMHAGRMNYATGNRGFKSDSILAEAAMNTPVEQAKYTRALSTFDEVAKAADAVLADKTTKMASVVKEAAARIRMIASKTAEEMEFDGARTAADYADPVMLPNWASSVRRDVTTLRNAFKNTAAKQPKLKDKDAVAIKQLSDKEVKGHIHTLLNEGMEPKKVAHTMDKIAQMTVFDKQVGADYLKQRAGVTGYAYMEPNSFMGSCSGTMNRVQEKIGSIRAKSVKQVKACVGCIHFAKDKVASVTGKRCSLYHLPIVGSKAELFTIISNLTPNAENKQAELIRQANREDSRPQPTTTHIRSTHTAGNVRTAPQGRREAAPTFTAKEASDMITRGDKLNGVFAFGAKKAGTVQAKAAIKEYVAGLRASKATVKLTQIDCTLIPQKLGSSNKIVGAKKCASCTYRSGMACGLTGGTLVGYPGMNKGAKKATLNDNAGTALITEFGMYDDAPEMTVGEIHMDNVELNRQSEIDI